MSGFDISVILGALPFLAKGLGLSLGLTAIAMIGGLALGLVIAIVRLSRFRVLAMLAALYVNGFRAVPLILVIFWFYFLVPLLLGPAGRRALLGADRLRHVRGGLLFRDHPGRPE
jgi:glutamate/aspartate transport system permease protein